MISNLKPVSLSVYLLYGRTSINVFTVALSQYRVFTEEIRYSELGYSRLQTADRYHHRVGCVDDTDKKVIITGRIPAAFGEAPATIKQLRPFPDYEWDKATIISGYLRDLIRRNKTAVRTLLTYEAETRPDATKAKNMMRTAELKTLRTIKAVSLRDHVRSKVIREDLEIQDVVRFTRARLRFWRDHVNRMTEDR
ncbi:hypothetical protein Trydic_g19093 [Trypoxylus dichotomus]